MRLTIAHLMKLVIFTGVACACIAPALELSGLTRVTPFGIVVFESMAIPLAWAMLSLLLVRDGPLKDAVILMLVLIAVSVGLGVFLWLCSAEIFPALMRQRAGSWPADRLTACVVVVGMIVLLSGAWVFLLVRLIRRVRELSKAR